MNTVEPLLSKTRYPYFLFSPGDKCDPTTTVCVVCFRPVIYVGMPLSSSGMKMRRNGD